MLKESIRKVIDTKHDVKKGNLNINKKPKNRSLDEIIKLYTSDITEAKKIQEDEQILLQYQGDDSLEKSLLRQAKELYGSTRKAASALGISQTQFVRKAKKYQL